MKYEFDFLRVKKESIKRYSLRCLNYESFEEPTEGDKEDYLGSMVMTMKEKISATTLEEVEALLDEKSSLYDVIYVWAVLKDSTNNAETEIILRHGITSEEWLAKKTG